MGQVPQDRHQPLHCLSPKVVTFQTKLDEACGLCQGRARALAAIPTFKLRCDNVRRLSERASAGRAAEKAAMPSAHHKVSPRSNTCSRCRPIRAGEMVTMAAEVKMSTACRRVSPVSACSAVARAAEPATPSVSEPSSSHYRDGARRPREGDPRRCRCCSWVRCCSAEAKAATTRCDCRSQSQTCRLVSLGIA